MKIIFISLWTQGTGMSGGDDIWINLAKQWSKKNKITILCSQEAKSIAIREGLKKVTYVVVSKKLGKNNLKIWNIIPNLIKRTVDGISFVLNNKSFFLNFDAIYSVSDFWPDSIPSFVIKNINKNITLVSSLYLFAPGPLSKDSPYKGKRYLIGLLYFLVQRPIIWLIRMFADKVFITSLPDLKTFVTKRIKEKDIVVIQGGIDLKAIDKFKRKNKITPFPKRKYDAVFIGRLHPQKGVKELIEIWRLYNKDHKHKLAIIGDGELKDDLEYLIGKSGQTGYIELLGYQNGDDKYKIVDNSRIAVHPAIYDSGGMAMTGSLAMGLPGISFDLEALKTYYPKGVIKIKCFDMKQFAKTITKLLEDKKLYKEMASDAKNYIYENWSWEKRCENIFKQTFK